MTTYSVIIGSPPGGSTLHSGAFGSFGCPTKDSTPAERLNMAFKFGKTGKGIEIGMHEGEIFDIRQLSRIRPDADFQIGKLCRERVAPCRGVADMFVEINDEQCHNRLPGHSIIVLAGILPFSYMWAFPGTHGIIATPDWTFAAIVVPWWLLISLYRRRRLSASVQDTILLLCRREALP